MQNSPVTQTAMGKIGAYLSPSKLPNFLAGLIIFFSATQLGLHFWPLSSLVYGIRIDYLSPTLYFLDLLILLYLGLATKGFDPLRRSWPTAKMFSRATTNSETRSDPQGSLVVLMPILLTNLLYSANPLATLSWSLHFLLYLLFLRTLLDRRPVAPGSDLLRRSPRHGGEMFSRTSKTNSETRSDPQGTITIALSLTLLFQLLLSITQVSLGHSVGGLMYYLGERSVAVGQPAVALGTFLDSVVLRAYGTFSHPNILAGWLVVSLLIILRLKPTTKYQILYTAIAAFGVALTQSRSALIALFGLIIPFYIIKNFKTRLIYLLVSLLVCWFVIPFTITPPRSDLSLSERLDLQGVSLQVVRQFPIFGAGAQASISTYPNISPTHRLLQPDHNSLTLFLSWFGLFGVLVILYSLRSQFENLRIWDLRFLLPLLPLFLLDHYFLTSPQGLFILLLYLSLALNYSHAQKNL